MLAWAHNLITMLVLTFALACASILAALSAQRVWEYVRAAWMLRRFPGPAPVSLVSGHVPLLNDAKRPPHAVVKELSEQHRGIFRLRLFWRQVGWRGSFVCWLPVYYA